MKRIKMLGHAALVAGLVLNAVTSQAADDKAKAKPAPKKEATPATMVGKPADTSKPVKVFIMMGQSNMFGMGIIAGADKKGTLEYFAKTDKKYPYLVDEAGNWVGYNGVRYVQVMEAKGQTQWLHNEWLTVKGKSIGPEIGFGHIIAKTLDGTPVLLLKTCIGNRGLGWDLLPPGSEQYEITEKAKDGTQKTMVYAGYKDSPNKWEKGTEPQKIEWYAGKQYDDDVANAKKVLADIGTYYPGATKYEVAGFLWFQGHKDQGEPYASRYEQNLVALIKALRKEFDAPNAKFVIATGCGNPGTENGGKIVAEAQLAVSGEKGKYPEFKGNVKTVDVRPLWPSQEDSPTKAGYHYFGNAGFYMETGLQMGQAMADLMKNSK